MASERPGPPADAERELAFAGVVHDVNQLLTVIAGRAEVLRLRGGVAAPDLEAIVLAARDAAAVLRRLRAGPRAAADAAADLGRCLDEVVLVHRPPGGAAWTAGEGPWRLVADLEAGLAAAVPPQVLREVLGNLVANAVEAMGAGGRLDVAARRHGDRVRLSVGDSGPGLAPADRECIFAAGWTTRRGEGRGVGLAASRQLLAAWGAGLDAGEPAAGGAVFVLDLPAAAAGPVGRGHGDGPVAQLPSPVLVVDDEPAVRDVLADVLGARGAQVVAVADAAAARAACAAGEFAVALVDLTLPGESGTDLARWLRGRDAGPAVVLMTGVDRGADLPSPERDACDAVATKPLDFTDLPALLARAVARRRGGDHAEGAEPR
ncbi:MAG: ATP-binding protein [Candidatus Krumholzibacteriia bacterium]